MGDLRYAYQQDSCSADGINCVYPAAFPLLFRILFKNLAAHIAVIDQQQDVAEEKHKKVADQHHLPRFVARTSPESPGNSITCQKDGAGEKHQKHIFFFSRSISLLKCIQKNASRQNILPQRRRAVWMDWRLVMGVLSKNSSYLYFDQLISCVIIHMQKNANLKTYICL